MSSSVVIVAYYTFASLARELKARWRPMTADGDSQEIAKQRGRRNLDPEILSESVVLMPVQPSPGAFLFRNLCL